MFFGLDCLCLMKLDISASDLKMMDLLGIFGEIDSRFLLCVKHGTLNLDVFCLCNHYLGDKKGLGSDSRECVVFSLNKFMSM